MLKATGGEPGSTVHVPTANDTHCSSQLFHYQNYTLMF